MSSHKEPPVGGSTLSILNIVISTPENREGAVRAGLQLGDHLSKYIDVDTVKMSGKFDQDLIDELKLQSEISFTPSRTALRDLCQAFINTDDNYENTVIWTDLSTPRSLAEYDLAHIHNAVPLWGLLAVAVRCRVARLPYVMTTHGISKIPDLPENMGMSETQQFVFEKAFLKPYEWVLSNAEHLLPLSKIDEKKLNNRVPTVSTSVIPNGVRLNLTEPEADPIEFDLPPEKPLLFFVGKTIKSKGIGDLLDAYELLNTDCTLIVAGPPADDGYVDRLQEYNEHEVRYLGYAEQEVLDALYRRADLFVFPTRSDVFPLVTLEALAAGTPVVSTTVGGVPEQITQDTGVLVSPEQPKELAEAVNELLANTDRRATMGDAAIARSKNKYSWDSVAQKTIEIYEQIVTRDQSTGG
jgi:glycosyltransferase involved in cell wall biosynthesis